MINPVSLPALRTRLFGRGADVAAVGRRLADSPGRLVTILGAAGCGKTSVALEVAHQAIPSIADDAFWISLDTCSESSAVAALVASYVVRNEASSGSPEQALAAALAGRQVLLVLDNCEHLTAGVAPLVDALLTRCPDVRVLATSRAALNVRGEEVFLLAPLPVPGGAAPAGPEAAKLASLELFFERSRAAGSDLSRDVPGVRTVARICTLLDGLPLAIELAAAQTLTFSPEQIVERLEARLPLPRGTNAGPERQRTMERAIDWSYGLLTEPSQRLLMNCSAFAGAWTLEALQAISSDLADVPARLSRLVEHSLVTVVPSEGERRFRLLAPVREFALARLTESGRLADIQEKHAQYYLDLTRMHRPWSSVLEPPEIEELRLAHDNYLAALARAEAAGDAGLVARLTASLWLFWRKTGQLYLGYERFRALVGMSPPGTVRRAMAHAGLANFEQLLGNYDAAIEDGITSLTLYREGGSRTGQIMMLGMLAEIAAESGNYEGARSHYREAISLCSADRPGQWATGVALLGLGFVDYWDENLDAAEALLLQGLKKLKNQAAWHKGLGHIRLGSIARRRRRLDAAVVETREGLRILDRLGGAQEVAHGLEELAATEHALGHVMRAATLLGAASALREETRSRAASADARATEALTVAIRRTLGEAGFTRHWVEGRALQRSGAVEFAISQLSASGQEVAPLACLTSRELEVARLVARGFSNAEIARTLVISDATARTHVERIRNKLGVSSRVHIARLVLDSVPSSPARA